MYGSEKVECRDDPDYDPDAGLGLRLIILGRFAVSD